VTATHAEDGATSRLSTAVCSVQSADALARGTKKQQSRSESSNLFCLAGQCACAKEHAILNVGPQERERLYHTGFNIQASYHTRLALFWGTPMTTSGTPLWLQLVLPLDHWTIGPLDTAAIDEAESRPLASLELELKELELKRERVGGRGGAHSPSETVFGGHKFTDTR